MVCLTPSRLLVPFFSLIFLVRLGDVMGFKQEMWLYLEDGANETALHFTENEPDLGGYNETLQLVTRACGKGRWDTYNDTNYQTFYAYVGSVYGDRLLCNDVNGTSIQFLRHWAASDTATDAISLYAGPAVSGIAGDEIYIDSEAYTGITRNISVLVASGTTNWHVFEGPDLSGKSLCVIVPEVFAGTTYNFQWYFNLEQKFNLSTVGSVFKGCDADQLETYKARHNLS